MSEVAEFHWRACDNCKHDTSNPCAPSLQRGMENMVEIDHTDGEWAVICLEYQPQEAIDDAD